METTKRRSFVQSMLCLFGGVAGASALERQVNAAPPAPQPAKQDGTIRLHLECRHKHRKGEGNGRVICGGEILEKAGGPVAGQFYANCFCSESTFGTVNPFAASNIEMHTIKLTDGTLFGMGANNSRTEREKTHAIIGGTGRFAGARGTYVIAENGAPGGAAELIIHLLS